MRFLNLYYSLNVPVPYQGVKMDLIQVVCLIHICNGEETRKLQCGIDLGFFKDRILFIGTFFSQSVMQINCCLMRCLPSLAGRESVLRNVPATIQNTSLEISLSTINLKTKNFNWQSSFNITIPKNKLLDFPGLSTSTYAYQLAIGQPLGSFPVYHFLGVDPISGEYIMEDANGHPTSSPNSVTDATVVINTTPKFYGGLQNSFRYKSFELDLLFQFVKQLGGNNVFRVNSFSPGQGDFFGGNSNQPSTVSARWRKVGDLTNIQRYSTSNDLNQKHIMQIQVMPHTRMHLL